MMSANNRLLEVSGLSKTFAGQRALDDVAITVGRHEIHALLGMNGSGKSTLIKVLAGYHQADRDGSLAVRFCGDPIDLQDRAWLDAFHVIHQDLGLIPTMNAMENIAIGSGYLTDRFGRITWRAERARAQAQLERLGLDIDPEAPVSSLSRAEATMVAMARALDGWHDDQPGVLVLDEPTAALSGPEVDQVIDAMRAVRDRGAGVVFVSHRLDEVFRVADRVTVLRDGRVVACDAVASFDHDSLVHAIAGAESEEQYSTAGASGPAALRVRGVSGRLLRDLDFDLHVGEILGIAGLRGSGREAVAPLIFGRDPQATGTLVVGDRAFQLPITPRDAIGGGVALVPADRLHAANLPKLSLRENIVISNLADVRRGVHIDRSREREDVGRWITGVGIAPAAPERAIEQFSGGNQQKAVIARALRTRPKVLLLDEPTQGVDVQAKVAIHSLLARKAEEGMGVLVCSSEVDELVRLCSRVLVLRNGEIWETLEGSALTERTLIAAAG